MISAVVLAAGLSIRMGKPKINLPWGDWSILGQVIHVLDTGGVDEIIGVIGHTVPVKIPDHTSARLKFIHNPDPGETDMLKSLQIGMSIIDRESNACLVVLGDQPQLKLEVVRALIAEYIQRKCKLLIPSYQKRRGHPWIVDRSLWEEIAALSHPATLRNFLAANHAAITYLVVDTDTILKDIDTPEEYSYERDKVDKASSS